MVVEDQEYGVYEKEHEVGHRWTAHDRRIIAKMEQYLNESDIVNVEFEELELLLGPEDSEIDVVCIVMNARRRKGRRNFQIFVSQGPSEFLVGRTLRWERRMEEARRRVEAYVEHL